MQKLSARIRLFSRKVVEAMAGWLDVQVHFGPWE